ADGLMSLPNAQVLAAAVSRPAKPSGATAQPDDANGQQSAPATPPDPPPAAPRPAPHRPPARPPPPRPPARRPSGARRPAPAGPAPRAPNPRQLIHQGPAQGPTGQPTLRVRRLVPADDLGGDAPALTHREPVRLRPRPDLRTVPAMRGRSPLC